MAEPVLAIRDLAVQFAGPEGVVNALHGVSLAIAPGETLGIVGESGSGKSQAMLAVLGLLASNGRATGSAKLCGEEMIGAPAKTLDRLRGRRATMIFQEPMTSLDPLFTIGQQIVAVIRRHSSLSAKAARAAAIAQLERVRIPDPQARFHAYPHELSGGQRQRVMVAMALVNKPDLLIADEPTTALDVTIQAEILALLGQLQRELGMAIAFITHDLGLVKHFCQRIVVMRHGRIVEEGPTARVFAAPAHAYTRALLDAAPRGRKSPVSPQAPLLLEAKGIEVTFEARGGFFSPKRPPIAAVRGVDLALREGETLGLVGESGSGKSTLGRALLRLVPASGLVSFEGRALQGLEAKALRPLRQRFQLVFQDPYGSLSPRLAIGDIVTEGLRVHAPELSARERDARAVQALEEVRLDPAARHRFPHEFSGGQRQRIAIARAMILRPKLVVLDEPTSALDRSVQSEIVALLRDLQARHRLAYLFISHDLAVVRAMADRVMVMKGGEIVEAGPIETVLASPRAEYTQKLLASAFL